MDAEDEQAERRLTEETLHTEHEEEEEEEEERDGEDGVESMMSAPTAPSSVATSTAAAAASSEKPSVTSEPPPLPPLPVSMQMRRETEKLTPKSAERESLEAYTSNGMKIGATLTVSSSQKPHGQSGAPSFKDSDIPDWIRKFETVMGHVNQYVLFDQIGVGAQGAVYKCLDLEKKKVYAIKALEAASLRKRRKVGSNINSLKNEIGIMKMLDHPNLVKLHEVIDDVENDRLYLVMDHIEGGGVMSDFDIMSGSSAQAIPEDKARKLFADFVRGIEYLHYHGVLHRDIKPSNLLIDNNTKDGIPRLKVCDFGVSSLCKDDKSARVLGEDDLVYVGGFGTVAMMSPEALGNGPDNIYHGRPADVWASGVTLYCMLTGQLPWSNVGDAEALRVEISSGQVVTFPKQPKLSKEVRKLIHRMLEADPAQRVTISLIKEDPWFSMVDDGDSVTIFKDLSPSQKEEIKPKEQDLDESVPTVGFFSAFRRGGKSSRSFGKSSHGNWLGNAFGGMFSTDRRSSRTRLSQKSSVSSLDSAEIESELSSNAPTSPVFDNNLEELVQKRMNQSKCKTP